MSLWPGCRARPPPGCPGARPLAPGLRVPVGPIKELDSSRGGRFRGSQGPGRGADQRPVPKERPLFQTPNCCSGWPSAASSKGGKIWLVFFFFFLMRNYLMLMFQLMQLLQQSSYKPNKTTGRQLTTSDRDRQYPNLLTAVKSFLQTKPHHHMEPRWVKGALPAGSEDRRGLRWSQDEQRPAPGRLKRGTIVTPTPEGQRWGFEDTRGSI